MSDFHDVCLCVTDALRLVTWPVAEELGLIFLTAFCDMLLNSALVVCLTVTSPLFAG